MAPLLQRLAAHIEARTQQVEAAVQLLDEGATVPFIARYRKEATGGLDDRQLRRLAEQLSVLRELDARRTTILDSIERQGGLNDTLRHDIEQAETRTQLEDLYLPWRPKRRSKATDAHEAGLEPLLDTLLQQPDGSPTQLAQGYLNAEHGIDTPEAALEGAKHLLAERLAEHAPLIGQLRTLLHQRARLQSRPEGDDAAKQAHYADYLNLDAALDSLPAHRILALFRARKEGVIALTLHLEPEDEARALALLRHAAGLSEKMDQAWHLRSLRHCWKVKLLTKLSVEVQQQLRQRAEEAAIDVFAHNLRDLLLGAPGGARPTLGIDPGLRTGIKVAALDATGRVLETATLYPHAPRKQWDESLHALAALCQRHRIELVAIGNGTASRESEHLVRELCRTHPQLGLEMLVVSESGASVYSASELASEELPDLDVSLRGAVSIARRLQDPLAELVKIDPRSIGVGQYQHDVNQPRLAATLDAVVEDCVNAVGVDLNTASPALLARVAGLGPGLANAIVAWRDANGAFVNRRQLLNVPRLGPRTFEQAAGFLRIRDGAQPLDASAVHPEAYPLVERIVQQIGLPLDRVLGNEKQVRALNPAQFTDTRFGLPTVRDVFDELLRPGRDPRPEFRGAQHREGIERPEDLEVGMVLEGTVSNVAAFGAFVDIGVHQDGLVHISQLADHFVRDPREVVRAGQVVRVRVMEVDLARKRIALSMRSDDATSTPTPPKTAPRRKNKGPATSSKTSGSLADAFARARR